MMNTLIVDEIARGLATRIPRREMLRGLGGGALTAALTRLGRQEVSAKPKKKCKLRKQIGQKCKLNNGATCKCRGGAQCKGGICTCPNGTKDNLGVCVPDHCTRTGLVCPNSSICCAGICGWTYNAFRCCQPNDAKCEAGGHCCQTDSTRSTCEGGRCCREEGAICDAVDNPNPPAKCCQGLVCSGESFRCEPI